MPMIGMACALKILGVPVTMTTRVTIMMVKLGNKHFPR